MLEVIALIFITREIGKLAATKGLKPLNWKIYTVLAWIIFEIWGFIIGILLFDKDNFFSIIMVGLMFAVTSYFWIKSRLNRMPDKDSSQDNNMNHWGK
ncbi:MAG: hypothetical protein ABIN48_00965 [Ginsengibacter sp.]